MESQLYLSAAQRHDADGVPITTGSHNVEVDVGCCGEKKLWALCPSIHVSGEVGKERKLHKMAWDFTKNKLIFLKVFFKNGL